MVAAVRAAMSVERSTWECTSGGAWLEEENRFHKMTESCDSFGWLSVTAQGQNGDFERLGAELCHFSNKNRHSSVRLSRKSF